MVLLQFGIECAIAAPQLFQKNIVHDARSFYQLGQSLAITGGELGDIHAQLGRRQARGHFIQLGGIGKLRGRWFFPSSCANCGGKKKYEEDESSHGHLDRDPASVEARRGPLSLMVW